MNKPFSQACINNRDPILGKIQPLLTECQSVLEVGSGTGQHAVYFSKALPHLQWQTGDVEDNHWAIQQWLDDEGGENCLPPLVLDVTKDHWPCGPYDAIFSANTLHILLPEQVEQFFLRVSGVMQTGSLLFVYGPFNYDGKFTSESNAGFDQWLKEQHPQRGIRDIEWINQLAGQQGLDWQEDYAMPANNRLQVWAKR